MGTLQKLVETLEQRGSLPQRLLDKEVQVGLHQLEAMLKLGVDGDGGGVYQWSKQQLDFGLALVDAVLCASCDLISGLFVCLFVSRCVVLGFGILLYADVAIGTEASLSVNYLQP
jgi:hypothetical protein